MPDRRNALARHGSPRAAASRAMPEPGGQASIAWCPARSSVAICSRICNSWPPRFFELSLNRNRVIGFATSYRFVVKSAA